MKVCLDTNAYSRLMLGHARLKDLLESVDEILVPATVLGEIYAGFELGSRRQANREQLPSIVPLTRLPLPDPLPTIPEPVPEHQHVPTSGGGSVLASRCA